MCHVIDVGQAVDTGHPKAREFLRRDLFVVDSFFRRKGVSGCLSADLAESFVVGYQGPFSCSSSDGGGGGGGGIRSGRVGKDAADSGEQAPLAGVELILEVRARRAFFSCFLGEGVVFYDNAYRRSNPTQQQQCPNIRRPASLKGARA